MTKKSIEIPWGIVSGSEICPITTNHIICASSVISRFPIVLQVLELLSLLLQLLMLATSEEAKLKAKSGNTQSVAIHRKKWCQQVDSISKQHYL